MCRQPRLLTVLLAGCLATLAAYTPQTRLGIVADPRDGTGKSRIFAINSRPVFLLGINYMGGLTMANDDEQFSSQLSADLDCMEQHGMNWLRVWADHFGAFEGVAGNAEQVFSVISLEDFQTVVPLYMNRLKRLIEECDRRGIIVDVSLILHHDKFMGDQEKRLAYVTAIARELKDYRNVYFFMWNLKGLEPIWSLLMSEMSQAVRAVDPGRLITTTGTTIENLDTGGDINEEMVGRWMEALGAMDVDFISLYTNNNAENLDNYLKVTREIGPLLDAYRRQMDLRLGRRLPILLEEPVRIDYLQEGEQPRYFDFFRELCGAKLNGAAGWLYHNGHRGRGALHLRPFRSLYLGEQNLLDQLQQQDGERWGFDNEMRVWREAAAQCGGSDINAMVLQPEFPEQVGHEIGAADPAGGCLRVEAGSQPGYLTTAAAVAEFPAGLYQATWRVRGLAQCRGSVLELTVADEAGKVLRRRNIVWRQDAAESWRELIVTFFVPEKGRRLGFATYWRPLVIGQAAGLELDCIRVRRVEFH